MDPGALLIIAGIFGGAILHAGVFYVYFLELRPKLLRHGNRLAVALAAVTFPFISVSLLALVWMAAFVVLPPSGALLYAMMFGAASIPGSGFLAIALDLDTRSLKASLAPLLTAILLTALCVVVPWDDRGLLLLPVFLLFPVAWQFITYQALKRFARPEWLRMKELEKYLCPKCCYDCAGLPAGSKCPECGGSRSADASVAPVQQR